MRNHLLEQLETFLFEVDIERDEPRDISTGARKIGDQAGIDRVPNAPHHDGNLRGCFFRRERGRCPPSHDHVHRQRNQFGREVGIAFLPALGEARSNDTSPALDVANLPPRVAKPPDTRTPQIRHKSDPADARRLLRARRARAWDGRAAEHREELAPLHSITSSARSRNDSGIVIPSALAVLRLMTSSNLVGCSTGMSPGFVPRKILST